MAKYIIFILLIMLSKVVCGQDTHIAVTGTYPNKTFTVTGITDTTTIIDTTGMTDTITAVQHGPDETYRDSANHVIIYRDDIFLNVDYLVTVFSDDFIWQLLEISNQIKQAHKAMIDRENNRVYNK